MNNFLYRLIRPANAKTIQIAYTCMRITIGILTIIHGLPKLFGGPEVWYQLGTFTKTSGISFLPHMWGLFGALIEVGGGLALAMGVGTRIASFFLLLMMGIVLIWHINGPHAFNLFSLAHTLALTLFIIYSIIFIIGGGQYSLDIYFYNRAKNGLR